MSLTRPTSLIAGMTRAISRWDDARRTRAVLGQLSKRELWDIGLDAGDITMDELTRRS